VWIIRCIIVNKVGLDHLFQQSFKNAKYILFWPKKQQVCWIISEY